MPGTQEIVLKARRVRHVAGIASSLMLGAWPMVAVASGETTVYHGNGDSLRCPAGVVRVAEIQAVVQGRTGAQGQVIGSASVEICADNETKYIDIVTRGAPDDTANNGQQGQKTGIDGSIQIHGRTARLNTNIYIPIGDADLAQCGRQDDSQSEGNCKPHVQVASFTGTWVFSLGKWTTFRTGADTAGSPVILAARILSGPVE